MTRLKSGINVIHDRSYDSRVKKRRKRAALVGTHSPDCPCRDEKFAKVIEAYNYLMNPEREPEKG